MNKKQFLALGKQLGLARAKSHRGLALRGQLDGAPVFVSQYQEPMGPDPRPRPFTDLQVERASAWRGALYGASPGHRGDTGDRAFDDRFAWSPHLILPEYGLPPAAPSAPAEPASPRDAPRPHYLGSPRLRQALLALDASIAAAIGHQGMVVFQIDHLETATRMMILTHLPQPALLEQALRLLVEVAGP
jgi:hypothetical protein